MFSKRNLVFFGVTFSFWLTIFSIIWQNMLVREKDGLYAGWVGVWGDWAVHMSYTTSLAFQNVFPPQLPILSGHILSYPFGVDLVSSMLLRLGIELIPAMIGVSLILSLILVCSLFYFFVTFTKNSKIASIATFLFLFNGGLGFLWFLQDFQSIGWSIFDKLPRGYTYLANEANIEWINIITSELIPQRGFLLGLPIALLNLSLFWKIFKNEGVHNWQMLAAGLLTGLLPLIHMHSLTVTAGFAAWTLFLTFSKGEIKKWLCFLFPALILSFVLIRIFYPQLGGQFMSISNSQIRNEAEAAIEYGSFITFKPGWLAPARGDDLFSFWLKNAGVMLFLPFVGFFFATKKQVLWSVPFWGIFVLANLFIFQPFDWDNTKYFTYWWLGVSVFAAIFIEKLLRNSYLFKILGLTLFLIAIFSGALDVLRVTQYENQKIHMFDNKALQFSRWIKTNTSPNAVFLTADNHDHPVPVLTGRSIVQGYSAWLWTYGIKADRKIKMEAIYRGIPEAAQYLADYKIDYIVLGPWERNMYMNLNESYLKEKFELVYEEEDIYLLKTNLESRE